MSREIKFRGRRLDNGEWVYGGYHKHEKVELPPVILKDEATPKPEYAHLIIQSGFADWNMPKPLKAIEVDPATVGQYTGLKDKNGVEIYEGDIIVGTYKDMGADTGLVVFKGCGFKVEIPNVGDDELVDWKRYSDSIEVIGNIYENPDLLEVD